MSAKNRQMLERTLFNLETNVSHSQESEMYSEIRGLSDEELINALNRILEDI